MTIKDFVKTVERIAPEYKWEKRDGVIIGKTGGRKECKETNLLCQVANAIARRSHKRLCHAGYDAAKLLRLDNQSYSRILDAVIGGSPQSAVLRGQLFQAVGLK